MANQDNFLVGELTRAQCAQLGWQCRYRASTQSTNNDAKLSINEDVFDLSEPILFITDQQTHGRGRGQNTWTSPHVGSYLLSSWVKKLTSPPPHTTAPQIGLKLWTCVKAVWPHLKWGLKAPNDLFLADQKIAGLLIENIQNGDQNILIVGLGLNVWAHPQEMTTATSLAVHMVPTTQEWQKFILEWCTTLNQLELTNNLTDSQCEELLTALKNTSHGTHYQKISPNGDLWSKDKCQPWWEI